MNARFYESISVQSSTAMGGEGSILARQKRDHIELDSLLRRLGEASADGQRRLLLTIYRLVFPHAFAEEAVIWPVMRRVLPDGQALTLKVECEHQQINELVTELEALDPGSPAHRQVLIRVVELLRQDVRDEEDKLLPRLQEQLSSSQLRRLGILWEIVRMIAPTRAHPIVSRRPPGNVISALPLALLDRCRDIVDARLHRREGAPAPALESLSSALARVSHAVERLPGMRRGENAATRSSRGGGAGWRAAATLAIVASSAGLLIAAVRR